MTNQELSDSIDKVCDYLYFTHKTYTDFSPKGDNSYCHCCETIFIYNKTNLTSQLYTLLHEAGHVLIRKNIKKYKKSFSISLKNDKFKKKSSKEYRTDILREEVLAWEKGLEIANRLKLNISEESYWKRARNNLYDYIKWAGDDRSATMEECEICND